MNPIENWRIGKTSDGSEIKWIPICTITFSSDYKRIIGLTQDRVWMNIIDPPEKNDIVQIKDREDCYWITAITEKERDEVEVLLKKGIEELNLSDELYNTFPFIDILKFSLDKNSPYWKQRACEWIREDEMDEELYSIIKSIIDKKQLDQKCRHKLFRFMKRFEKKKGSISRSH